MTYNLNYQLNSDEIKLAANVMTGDDLQFINSVDSEHTQIERGNYAFIADIVIPNFLELDKTKPIYMPMVIAGHDVLLSLLPKQNGAISAYYNDSFGFIDDGDRKYIAKTITWMLKAVDDRVEDLVDLSVFQQFANCCGLSVVSNIINLHNAHSINREIGTEVLYQGEDMESYYTNLGESSVAPFLTE